MEIDLSHLHRIVDSIPDACRQAVKMQYELDKECQRLRAENARLESALADAAAQLTDAVQRVAELEAELREARSGLMDASVSTYLLKSQAKTDCKTCDGTGIEWVFQYEGNTPSDGFSYPVICQCTFPKKQEDLPQIYTNDIPF